MDEHNKAVLTKLGKLLDSGSRVQLRAFRNETRKEYRSLKEKQLTSWARYQKELIAKRDAMLEKHFGMNHQVVKRTMAYEASEYLGENLDDRFSAKSMARFLVRHLDRKGIEARKLTDDEGKVEAMTAALYNGGSHNVKRMLAGLIRTLPETEKYMRKVPATRRRLDSVIAAENGVRTLR
jgi:Glu-tRNA(Gln) amidotransferase subunit E-like FAD-binding protein